MRTTDPIGDNCKLQSDTGYVVASTGDASYTAVTKYEAASGKQYTLLEL